MNKELFDNKENIKMRPLAYRLRPHDLSSFKGQQHLLAPGKKLRKMIDSGRLFSVIFWGPPGCGKTALAGIISRRLEARVSRINAVNSNVSRIRNIIKNAKMYMAQGEKTVLIVDEIHRFARNQQESLLPDVEEGNITLVGITTENPYYFISGPLLSRTTVYKFRPLDEDSIVSILKNAVSDPERGYGGLNVEVTDEALRRAADVAAGDARYGLNLIELAVESLEPSRKKVDREVIETCIGGQRRIYDRSGDAHYDNISAMIKSIRGSDADAALYYLANMTTSGEDPRFIARRIVIAASEDIGNADPRAVLVADAALRVVEKIGMPEARIILAQAVIYLATAPKSNRACEAINKAESFCRSSSLSVPDHLTKAGRSEYKYPHNYKYGYVKQKYWEGDENFYSPTDRGHEKYIKKYIDFINNLEETPMSKDQKKE
ncbi:MAG: replication-associated recombination protein A [Elusimicrobiota bacterium]|nr:replication-associated recombination protein A [Elusimicrobiota bacterium]